MRAWHPIIDEGGIRYVAQDACAAGSLAALPGPSLLTTESEALLLASGVRPLRNSHSLVIGAILRDGSVVTFVPDAFCEPPVEDPQPEITQSSAGDVPPGIKALTELFRGQTADADSGDL